MNMSRTPSLFIFAILLGLSAGLALAAENGHSVVAPDEVEWQEGPDFIDPGAELAPLAATPPRAPSPLGCACRPAMTSIATTTPATST